MFSKEGPDGPCAILSTQICCTSKMHACTPASVLFFANISVLLLCEVVCPAVQGSLMMPPKEITLVLISPSTIQVTWTCSNNSSTTYEVVYHPAEARYKIVLEAGTNCQATLEQLIPSTRYQLLVSALNGSVRNDSAVIYFRTEPYAGSLAAAEAHHEPMVEIGESGKPVRHYTSGTKIRGEEVGIVLLVLFLWVAAVFLFFHRWGKIRMLEPYQPQYHKEVPHSPSSCPLVIASAAAAAAQQASSTYPRSSLPGELCPGLNRQLSNMMDRYHSFPAYSSSVHPFSNPFYCPTSIAYAGRGMTPPYSTSMASSLGPGGRRPRTNSVFSASFLLVPPVDSRRARSVENLSTWKSQEILENSLQRKEAHLQGLSRSQGKYINHQHSVTQRHHRPIVHHQPILHQHVKVPHSIKPPPRQTQPLIARVGGGSRNGSRESDESSGASATKARLQRSPNVSASPNPVLSPPGVATQQQTLSPTNSAQQPRPRVPLSLLRMHQMRSIPETYASSTSVAMMAIGTSMAAAADTAAAGACGESALQDPSTRPPSGNQRPSSDALLRRQNCTDVQGDSDETEALLASDHVEECEMRILGAEIRSLQQQHVHPEQRRSSLSTPASVEVCDEQALARRTIRRKSLTTAYSSGSLGSVPSFRRSAESEDRDAASHASFAPCNAGSGFSSSAEDRPVAMDDLAASGSRRGSSDANHPQGEHQEGNLLGSSLFDSSRQFYSSEIDRGTETTSTDV